jgi:hypothetical protein
MTVLYSDVKLYLPKYPLLVENWKHLRRELIGTSVPKEQKSLEHRTRALVQQLAEDARNKNLQCERQSSGDWLIGIVLLASQSSRRTVNFW